MSYHHFSDSERSEIKILLSKGYSNHQIGISLARHHTTIGREISTNSTNGTYDPPKAKVKARQRRRYSKYQGMKINDHDALRTYVIAELKKFRTPEQISGRLKEIDQHLPYVSKKAIYEWLYTARGQKYCCFLPSKRLQPKKRREKKTERFMIPNRRDIAERSKKVGDRSRYGDFETDTVVSGKKTRSKAALTVLHERKSRYVRLKKIPSLRPTENRKAIVKMGESFVVMHTLTHDNGIENKEHEQVAEALDLTTYFCRPYASWEKGGIENMNGRIRRFIPKGCDIDTFSDAEIQSIEDRLNNTPRKCLKYRTPHEIMSKRNLLTSPDSTGALEG